MTLEELEAELIDRSAWQLTLEGEPRSEEEASEAPANAVAVAIETHGGYLIAVEVTTDDAGAGVVNIRTWNPDGELIAPNVFDGGTSIMVHAS